MNLLTHPILRIGLTLLIVVCCLGGLVQPKAIAVYVFVASAMTMIGVSWAARDRIWRLNSWLELRVGLCVGVIFLSVASLSLLWFVPQQPLPWDRVPKLALMGFALAVLMVVPIAQSTARAIAMGVLIGAALVGLILIENWLVGYLGTIFFGPAESPEYDNFYKAPATILAILVFPAFLFCRALQDRQGLRRVSVGLFYLVFLGVLLSGHMTSIFALIMGIVITLMTRWIPRLTGGLILVGVLSMMIVLPVISNPPLTNSLLAVTKQHGSLQHRVLILDFALSRIQEHSLLGWGLDSSRSIPHGSERIVDTPDRMNVLDGSLFSVGVVRVGQNLPLHPHNNLIQIRLELGLPGVLVTVLAFFLIIRTIVSLP
ncbi:MAG: O-antigen ligase family protein, partial [Alphaproteobacteria bacterium]|nr:O-antigen ligase family protein [Alphaproteobacteria bacterium]